MKNLFQKLSAYAALKRASFAMPGHKGGRGFSEEFKSKIAEIDVTELADTENLHAPRSLLVSASERLAKIYGSERSFFLTGGSTSGVHIMMHSVCTGGKLLVNRNCHRSVINCAALSGYRLKFLGQDTDKNLLCPLPPTAAEVEKALSEDKEIAAVLITSPDYYGHMADIAAISRVCHKEKIPLLVDEAHGAHLAAFGKGAIMSGADMAVNSAHKTLNALNQAAYLHIKSDLVDKDRVAALAPMVQTSSPSYPIVASAELALGGIGEEWKKLAGYIDKKRTELKKNTKVAFAEGETDPTRIVFGLSGYEITGYEMEKVLRERYNIDVEMSDRFNVVAIATPANTTEEIDSLFAAAEEILSEAAFAQNKDFPMPPAPVERMTARDAFFAKGEKTELSAAEGRVSKTNITAYPPGTAIVAIGEEITAEHIEYITGIKRLGAEIEGMENGKVSVVLK